MQIDITAGVQCIQERGTVYNSFIDDTVYTAYNSYLISGEKSALIGVIHDDIMSAAKYKLDKKPDYLVCCHTGTEYVKNIGKILTEYPDAEVTGTVAAIKNLKEMLNFPFKEHIVKNGAVLNLGKGKSLEFMIAPCLPWQDTMLTYLREDKLLFTGHLFGSVTEGDFSEYYTRVLSPHREYVQNAVRLASESGARVLLPCCGGLITDKADEAMADYKKLCGSVDGRTIAVIYPKKHANTSKMAEIIVSVLRECGLNVSVLKADDSNAVKLLNTADAVIIGTPTINKNMSKEVCRLIAELDAVTAKGKPYFVFGSYGWSGEGLELLHRHLKELRMRPFDKPLGAVFTPSEKEITAIREYVCRFAEGVENIWKQN